MDESGIHDGARVCVVAGYYGTQTAWVKFEEQWRRVLRDYNIEEAGFHAKRFWKRKKGGDRVPPYEGWGDDRANKFIERLVNAIARNRIFPFGYGVVVEHWAALPLNTRKLMTGAVHRKGRFVSSGSPNRSYYLPFMFSVAASLAHSGATETGEKVHFFVGLDKTFSDYAKDMYKRTFTDPRIRLSHLLGTIAFPLSKDTPQLQAADLLAHRLYSDYMAFLRGDKPKKTLSITRLLIRNRRQELELFDAAKLRELLEQYKADAIAKTGRTPPFLD
jgi:hypothetical protein